MGTSPARAFSLPSTADLGAGPVLPLSAKPSLPLPHPQPDPLTVEQLRTHIQALLALLQDDFRRLGELERTADPAHRWGRVGFVVPATGERLSRRELEVLVLLAEGLSNADVARELVISLHTVKHHVASVLAKLGVDSRTRAVAAARRLGLV